MPSESRSDSARPMHHSLPTDHLLKAWHQLVGQGLDGIAEIAQRSSWRETRTMAIDARNACVHDDLLTKLPIDILVVVNCWDG